MQELEFKHHLLDFQPIVYFISVCSADAFLRNLAAGPVQSERGAGSGHLPDPDRRAK